MRYYFSVRSDKTIRILTITMFYAKGWFLLVLV